MNNSFAVNSDKLSSDKTVPFFKDLKSSSTLAETSVPLTLALMLDSNISSSAFLSFWTDSISALSIEIALSSFSIPCLLNTLTSTTTPFVPEGIFKDESLTSIAFSPKIALNNFSSAFTGESPFGVTFPTNISPGLTSAPT